MLTTTTSTATTPACGQYPHLSIHSDDAHFLFLRLNQQMLESNPEFKSLKVSFSLSFFFSACAAPTPHVHFSPLARHHAQSTPCAH